MPFEFEANRWVTMADSANQNCDEKNQMASVSNLHGDVKLKQLAKLVPLEERVVHGTGNARSGLRSLKNRQSNSL